MPIRSEEELANIVGLSLQSYANRVLNGAVQPFLGLLKEDRVEVTFVVTEEGGFAVKREPAVSVMPEVEIPTPTETFQVVDEPISEVILKPVKPKRTRRKKEKPVENPSIISA